MDDSIVGKRAMFNPIYYGKLTFTDGTEIVEAVNPQVQIKDEYIEGTVLEDNGQTVQIAGPIELNGWWPVYFMSKVYIAILPDGLNDNC